MVEYRKIKTIEGLEKGPTQGMAEKIPETFATTRIHEDKDLTVTTISQKNLTSDCWLVQFNGFRSCVGCEVFLKPDCGGGKTIARMIIDHFSDSIITKMKYNEFWSNEETKDKSFYDFVKWTKQHYAFRYSFKKYRNHIRQLQSMAEEPKGPDLDNLYPFWNHHKQPNNEIIEQSGYHQHHKCDCEKTTKKGSYRDVVISFNDKTLYYYHQHCIMVKDGERVILNSAGHRAVTTKERINRYLKRGWTLYSDKRVWWLAKRRWNVSGQYEYEKGPIRFYDGIELVD